MSISKETVDYVARLARIELAPNELEKLSSQLETILNFIDRLEKLEVKDVAETSHILPINNVFKPDRPVESLAADQVLMNAPAKQSNFFVVPKIIE